MQELSAEQKLAVESTEKNILVIAGPGAGKSFTLVSRINRLVSQGVDPKTICAISFTNAAANVMRERLGDIKLGWCGTLHSLMFKLIQEEYPGASVMDEESTEELLTECIYRLKYAGTKKVLKETIAKGSPSILSRPSLVELVAHDFYGTMVRNKAFSFDSILVFGHALVQEPGLACKFTHLLCDEHQDAGEFDAKIYRDMLAEHKFFVGDPDQSLYGFRGANVQHIIDLSKTAWTTTLATNYRSDRHICLAANSIIRNNRQRVEKLTQPNTFARGHVSVESHSSADDELMWLAQTIRDLQESGAKLSECAVLVRTNDLVSKISNGLKAFSIPVLERTEAQLPEDWRKAMLALSTFASPNNDFLMKRFLYAFMPCDCDTVGVVAEAARKFTSINRVYKHWPANPLASWVPVAIGPLCLSTLSNGLIQDAVMGLPAGATASDLLVELRSNPPMVSVGKLDGVYIGTIHSAKGREWDNVFLPAFEDQIIPGERAGQIEEERRVAFVAITRARHRLYFSSAEYREMPWKMGVQTHKPSRFIEESGVKAEL